jgi:hypothetical protein
VEPLITDIPDADLQPESKRNSRGELMYAARPGTRAARLLVIAADMGHLAVTIQRRLPDSIDSQGQKTSRHHDVVLLRVA